MISGLARFVRDNGAEETAIKLLKRKYGEQIGRTSKTGKRAFKKTTSDGREVLTVLNKDYFISGELIKKEIGSKHVNYEKLIYNYDGDVLVRTNVVKEKRGSKKPTYFYHETRYDKDSPKTAITQRQGIFNAEKGIKQEINIPLQ